MRKLVTLPVSMILLFTLVGCSLIEPSELSIEMIAFNSLSKEEQGLITVSPKDSIVAKITVNDGIKSQIDSDYDGAQVYSVTFNDTETDSAEELTVFVSLDKKTVVGK